MLLVVGLLLLAVRFLVKLPCLSAVLSSCSESDVAVVSDSASCLFVHCRSSVRCCVAADVLKYACCGGP